MTLVLEPWKVKRRHASEMATAMRKVPTAGTPPQAWAYLGEVVRTEKNWEQKQRIEKNRQKKNSELKQRLNQNSILRRTEN